MSRTTEKSHQLHTIFGNGYVAEQHSEEAQRKLPSSGGSDFTADVSDILKKLRGALSLQ